jgi:DNA topoisomerase-6 subunit B
MQKEDREIEEALRRARELEKTKLMSDEELAEKYEQDMGVANSALKFLKRAWFVGKSSEKKKAKKTAKKKAIKKKAVKKKAVKKKTVKSTKKKVAKKKSSKKSSKKKVSRRKK